MVMAERTLPQFLVRNARQAPTGGGNPGEGKGHLGSGPGRSTSRK